MVQRLLQAAAAWAAIILALAAAEVPTELVIGILVLFNLLDWLARQQAQEQGYLEGRLEELDRTEAAVIQLYHMQQELAALKEKLEHEQPTKTTE